MISLWAVWQRESSATTESAERCEPPRRRSRSVERASGSPQGRHRPRAVRAERVHSRIASRVRFRRDCDGRTGPGQSRRPKNLCLTLSERPCGEPPPERLRSIGTGAARDGLVRRATLAWRRRVWSVRAGNMPRRMEEMDEILAGTDKLISTRMAPHGFSVQREGNQLWVVRPSHKSGLFERNPRRSPQNRPLLIV
jgi:hypothetical protein